MGLDFLTNMCYAHAIIIYKYIIIYMYYVNQRLTAYTL
nr:MAG TPA: hypothetical protein [Caudoviricetes sp.]